MRQHRRQLAFSNKLVSGTGARQERRHQGLRHAVRRRHRRPGPICDHPGGRLQPGQPARTSRAATTGSPARSRSCQTGWLGRWLDNYGSQRQPAAGGLARLQPVEADPLLEGARVRARGPPGRAASRCRTSAWTSPTPTAEVGKLAAVPFAARQRRARPRARHEGPHGRRAGRLGTLTGDARARATRRTAASRSSCSSRRRCSRPGLGTRIITIDWGSFDTHGDQIAGAGSAAHTLSAGAGRVQGRPGRPRHRAEGRDDGVLRVRPARRGERLRGHRPRRGRPDHASAARPSAAASRRRATPASTSTRTATWSSRPTSAPSTR